MLRIAPQAVVLYSIDLQGLRLKIIILIITVGQIQTRVPHKTRCKATILQDEKAVVLPDPIRLVQVIQVIQTAHLDLIHQAQVIQVAQDQVMEGVVLREGEEDLLEAEEQEVNPI